MQWHPAFWGVRASFLGTQLPGFSYLGLVMDFRSNQLSGHIFSHNTSFLGVAAFRHSFGLTQLSGHAMCEFQDSGQNFVSWLPLNVSETWCQWKPQKDPRKMTLPAFWVTKVVLKASFLGVEKLRLITSGAGGAVKFSTRKHFPLSRNCQTTTDRSSGPSCWIAFSYYLYN